MKKVCLHLFTAMLLIAGVCITTITPAFADQPLSSFPPLMISEIQTDGLSGTTVNGTMEFVELYNPSDQPLNVADWQIQYLSASSTGSGLPTRILATLEGVVIPHGYVLLSYQAYLDNADIYFGAGNASSSGWLARSGGHVRIVDGEGATIDLVGWGSATAIGDWWRSPEIPAGMSLQRILPSDPAYTTGFTYALSNTPGPMYGGLQLPITPPTPDCVGVQLSELLPNPVGSDTGSEFIELYNPNDTDVALAGCSLRLGEDGPSFALPNDILPAHMYRAFSDTETGITLPNATAQTMWLHTSNGDQGVLYPNGMSDGESWAFIDGVWQATNTPTPGAANTLPVVAPAVNRPTPPSGAGLAACPSGKVRNPNTNRCRTIPLTNAPVPCRAGQIRSADTGRCRSASSIQGPQPCSANQERNPQTGRCRLISATAPKSCPVGQERNPATNRCRKSIATTPKLSSVQDIATSARPNAFKWWFLAATTAGLLGYGVYEWRHDIQNRLYVRKHKRQMSSQEVEDG